MTSHIQPAERTARLVRSKASRAWPEAAVACGVLIGLAQLATPIAFWWLSSTTVYAFELVLIAAIYIGFAVADGRARIVAAESAVATAFVVVGAAALTGSPWLLVAGYAGHGVKDLWQHRTGFVNNTRWWPPFCLTVDFVVAAALAVAIATGHAPQ